MHSAMTLFSYRLGPYKPPATGLDFFQRNENRMTAHRKHVNHRTTKTAGGVDFPGCHPQVTVEQLG